MSWKPFDFFKYDPESDGNKTFSIQSALNDNWDHTKELIEEVRERVENTEESTGNYQSKPVTDEDTLLAAIWSTEDKSYSFESDYPNAQYDIVIELDGGAATEAQTEAWDSANIKGNYPENILYAKGDLPAVDIPVIRQVIKK